MDNIIVTITNLKKSYFYDVEIPVDIILDKLKFDIVETLNGYNPRLMLRAEEIALLCNRTGMQIQPNETMADAGVWNGDYITLI